jgi:hypothetical protein
VVRLERAKRDVVMKELMGLYERVCSVFCTHRTITGLQFNLCPHHFLFRSYFSYILVIPFTGKGSTANNLKEFGSIFGSLDGLLVSLSIP